GEVRGKGLMIGVEMVRDKSTKEPAADEAKKVRDLCRENGVLVGRGGPLANVIRLQPPLTLTEDQADQAASVLEKALKEVGG
ncbi:MAG: aminotransferase class III-fold pyridoxal phosphate-dependent enzyme, partial [Planctomycetota bacterium]